MISREEAIKYMEVFNGLLIPEEAHQALDMAIEALYQPERPKGRWEEDEDYFGSAIYKCTACGEEWILNCGTPEENNMNFCPKCGAEMVRGKEE